MLSCVYFLTHGWMFIQYGSIKPLGLKKKLFDWRNLTDPIFTADPKYFYFFVCKKRILKTP